ncbi:hypothetical protein [Enterococcus sp. 5H]|uniref:hypothetical protein n=1 Tax=Enterococcus sp. 5H TaxID=1229490 RepID=UPI0023032CBB|nr:hypothetical protein [Enterococcus sp. 5H]MDA9472951.1 hypothetical protein [Enterococcus sp. 5H]
MDKYSELMKNNDSNLRKPTVKLISSRDSLYSGWEITRISKTINNVYYQNELINTIRALLIGGTDPKDIYVLNDSVNIGNQYTKYSSGIIDIDNKKGLVKWYHLGSPISLFPDKFVSLIFLIFEAYRETVTFCNKNQFLLPNKEESLFEMKQNINNLNFSIKDTIFRFIISKNNIDKNTKEKMSSLEKKLDFYDKKMEETKSNNYSVEFIIENMNDNKMKFDPNSEFKKYFLATNRPIVLVREENNLRILCSELIVRSKFQHSNYRFFENKSISQNSPLCYIVAFGIGFLPTLINVTKQRIYLHKTRIDNLKRAKDKDEEILILENEIEELEKFLNDNVDDKVVSDTIELSSKNKLREAAKFSFDSVNRLQKVTEKATLNIMEENNITILNEDL